MRHCVIVVVVIIHYSRPRTPFHRGVLAPNGLQAGLCCTTHVIDVIVSHVHGLGRLDIILVVVAAVVVVVVVVVVVTELLQASQKGLRGGLGRYVVRFTGNANDRKQGFEFREEVETVFLR